MVLILSSASVSALSAAGAVLGAYLCYRGVCGFQRRRLLLNIPRSKIRGAPFGPVEVGGLATGGAVLTSALRQVECFYYRSLAWELRQRGSKSEWVKIADESLHVPFTLDDGTGRLLVDTRGAEMDLYCDWREEFNRPPRQSGSALPAGADHFLARNGANFSRRLKVEEYLIRPKNFLYVLGTLAANPAPKSASRDLAASRIPEPAARVSETQTAMPAGAGVGTARPFTGLPGSNVSEIVHLSPEAPPQSAAEMTEQQRLASALMKAGIGNPAAWDAPPSAAPQKPAETRRYSAPVFGPVQAAAVGKIDAGPGVTDLAPHPPIVLKKGADGSPFRISSRSQRDLARSLGWRSAVAAWGGLALTLVSLAILGSQFHLG